ncbi:hypothetical protein SLEP1_g25689 [Rubroshorea leprosula]|uniref:Uncharacterized protein n=1 Tax=Rubroshorea leprosula TaxID=152421 RepID=A0AAV5JQB4_9ROSI|nr:hypothetical protein SLEP1_g25689 [Rubroshorea leprosula]
MNPKHPSSHPPRPPKFENLASQTETMRPPRGGGNFSCGRDGGNFSCGRDGERGGGRGFRGGGRGGGG